MGDSIRCPACFSPRYKKNGHTHNQKQNHRCKECGRQFILNPQRRKVDSKQRDLIERLLLERISLRGICRVMGVSLQWLLQYMVQLYEQQPLDLNFQVIANPEDGEVAVFPIDVQVDEMWSFVGEKENKQWIWIAMVAANRQIIAFEVGDRSARTAKKLWKKIPTLYRKHATFYTDNWDAYADVLPKSRHQIVSKDSGLCSYIERFNCTLRQRNSRLVRKSLSFSKSEINHVGSIRYFICHYNTALLV